MFPFTEKAEADLKHIWKHTHATWGEGQADRYLYGIDDCCHTLAETPHMGKIANEVGNGVRILRYENHYICYLIHDDTLIVIAILHERMNLLARIKSRLDY